MEKIDITESMIKNASLISDKTEHSKIYRINKSEGLKDSLQVLKIFDSFVLELFRKTNVTLEKRILTSNIQNIGINEPTAAGYFNGECIGYFSPFVDGITDAEYDCSLTLKERCDLSEYGKHYLKLEKIVKDSPNIVIPDLLTVDNIMIYKNEAGEKVIKLVDWDGIQVDDKMVFVQSTLIDEDVLDEKKYHNNNLYTKQFDIKSLIHYYFLMTFNINLNTVGMINPMTNKRITLDDVFNMIGLENYDIMNKVWKVFSNKENEYLGEDVLDLAQEYNMCLVQEVNPKEYIKRLFKK